MTKQININSLTKMFQPHWSGKKKIVKKANETMRRIQDHHQEHICIQAKRS